MKRIFLILACSSWLAPAQTPACRSVEGDRIQARDLAAVLPEFAGLPPETLIGQAPVPGSQRTFHNSELKVLARRYGIEVAPDAEACFQWAMAPLGRAAALDAMQAALAIPDAKIEIADLMTDPVPGGKMEFPLNRLGKPSPSGPTAPVLWNGDVIYGDGHRFSVWARVSISAPCQRLVAAESLKTGRVIAASQVRTAAGACFPGAKQISLDEVAGMVPLRPISAGAELRAEYLSPPNDVDRGDAVDIEVRSGGARLRFSGRALSAGRNGDMISVRNPDSNRTFEARVTGKDAAVVEISVPRGM